MAVNADSESVGNSVPVCDHTVARRAPFLGEEVSKFRLPSLVEAANELDYVFNITALEEFELRNGVIEYLARAPFFRVCLQDLLHRVLNIARDNNTSVSGPMRLHFQRA